MLVRRGAVELAPGRMRVHDGGVQLDLAAATKTRASRRGAPTATTGVRDTGGHDGGDVRRGRTLGAGEVWTRKQAGVRAHGTLALDGGPPRSIEALAVIDDTAGYHARHTEWWWSAGVGTGEDGAALAWNLVAGVNDPPTGSERAVWIDGAPSETGAGALRDGPERDRRGRTLSTTHGCASRQRPCAGAARTCWSCAATTPRRSARSPARCPAASAWRAGWA